MILSTAELIKWSGVFRVDVVRNVSARSVVDMNTKKVYRGSLVYADGCEDDDMPMLALAGDCRQIGENDLPLDK